MPTRAMVAAAGIAAACALGGGATAHSASPGGWIVYWSDASYPSIWAVRPDGSDEHQILRNGRNSKRPRLSPDRAWIAFDGTPPGKPLMSDFDLQLVRLDGSGLRTLTSARAWDTDAQWSPDGSWLSFTRSPPRPQDCTGASIWIIR